MNFSKSKIALGVFGTILIGVLSSAIWDGVKPFTKWLYEQALYVSVLGIDKLKDDIYVDIAKGYHENASLEIYSLLSGFLVGFLVVSMILAVMLHMYENGNDHIAGKIKNLIKWPRNMRGRSFVVFMTFYFIFSVTILSFNLVKTKYINDAFTYYNQLVYIVVPYAGDHQINLIKSDFAQIKSKSDYELVIKELLEIVNENDLNKPDFSFIF